MHYEKNICMRYLESCLIGWPLDTISKTAKIAADRLPSSSKSTLRSTGHLTHLPGLFVIVIDAMGLE